MSTKTQRRQLKFDKNPIESIRDSGSSFMDSTKDAFTDEFNKDISLAWRQLLGVKEDDQKQKNNNEEEVIFQKKEKKSESAPAIDYISEILHSEVRISSENHRVLNTKIEELRIEISKLANSSKQLEIVVKDVSMQNISSNPGKYHLNFFEWVLATIQSARIRVEESANWLTTVGSKSQKRSYWNLAKKHGTSFMLSGERTPAQSTG